MEQNNIKIQGVEESRFLEVFKIEWHHFIENECYTTHFMQAEL